MSEDKPPEGDIAGIALTWKPEQFRGNDPELWAELAVRQCLAAAVTDAPCAFCGRNSGGKYVTAVDNLESCMDHKLDDEYKAEIASAETKLKHDLALDGNLSDEVKAARRPVYEWSLARFKFRQLVRLVGRSKREKRKGRL